jgi:predicted MFS family arabinose efflux permease
MLVGSTMLVQTGSWVQTIGQGWLVKEDLGGSATDLATVALLRGASLLLLSPLGGYLSGRFERRLQLVGYSFASAMIAGLLAVLVMSGSIEIWMVYCTALVAGAVDAVANPIRAMLVFDSVNTEELTNAVAINSLGGSAMRVVGPAIGGALIGLVGTQGTFQLQAVCLVAAAGVTWLLRPSHPEAGLEREGMLRSMAGGLAYVIRDRRMLIITLMAIIPSILIFPYVTFLPVFAKDVLHSDESGYGYLAAAVGAGSLIGGAAAATYSGRGRMGPGMMVTCVLYAFSIAGFTLMRNLWLAVAMLALAGVFFSVYSAFNASLMQLKAAPAYRSRVISLQTMTWGMTPFAGVIMGRQIDRWGAPHVVFGWVIAAAAVTLVVLACSREMRKI